MEESKKIFLLLLINLGLAFFLLYLLDMYQIVDYKQVLQKTPFLKNAYNVKIEDSFLLEKLELEKKWNYLDQQRLNLSNTMKELEKKELSLKEKEESLAKEKEAIENMIANFERMKEEKAAYDLRVDEIAAQIENMPPASAVKILEKQDDLMLVDIFRRMNARAEERGVNSIVPYLLSLLDPELSARVQRKMLE